MIYENIKQLASQKGVSIAALEKLCGFGNGTIRRWEESSLTVENLQKVANFFKVPIKKLID